MKHKKVIRIGKPFTWKTVLTLKDRLKDFQHTKLTDRDRQKMIKILNYHYPGTWEGRLLRSPALPWFLLVALLVTIMSGNSFFGGRFVRSRHYSAQVYMDNVALPTPVSITALSAECAQTRVLEEVLKDNPGESIYTTRVVVEKQP